MTSARARKERIMRLQTRGCGVGRHAWATDQDVVFDEHGKLLQCATRWHCWVCHRVEVRPPIGTFHWMAAQVVRDRPEMVNWNDIGGAVERRFYPEMAQ